MTSRTLPLATPDAAPIDALRDTVRERYGTVAARVAEGSAGSCCAPSGESSGCCGSTTETWDPITADLYDAGQTAGLPAEALLASLGCGNPTALAALRPGDVVLDLGAGGGIDVLLSAKRVGPTGKAYGLDMTDEMLTLARANQAKAGATNVEFLKGHIEAIPLPDASVDVIISNCVINLSGDKRRVLAEAFRVLRPGGRFAVSDVIVRESLPDEVRASMPLWTGCVSGALGEREFIDLLHEAGFEQASIEPTREYTRDDALALLAGTGLDTSLADRMAGTIMSGFVRAQKPATGTPRLRPATAADLPAIEALLTSQALPLDGVRALVDALLVAEAHGRIVGVAGLEGNAPDALLRSVAVEAAWQGRGVGDALVQAVLQRAATSGVTTVYLLTTTAEHWFPRFGFAARARDDVPAAIRSTAEFHSACPASAAVMARRLEASA